MDMKNGLAGVTPVIDHHAVAVLFKTFLYGNGFCNKEQVTNDLTVRDGYSVDVMDMFFRHDQRVRRRLGIDVLEGKGELIFVDDLGGDLFFDDLAEYAVWVKIHRVLLKREENPVKCFVSTAASCTFV